MSMAPIVKPTSMSSSVNMSKPTSPVYPTPTGAPVAPLKTSSGKTINVATGGTSTPTPTITPPQIVNPQIKSNSIVTPPVPTIPEGWDAETYQNFKTANPTANILFQQIVWNGTNYDVFITYK